MNNLLMQFQADIINAAVERPSCVETTAMGAAYLAGLAVGYWKDKADVVSNRAVDKVFSPDMPEADVKEKIKGWQRAVKCALAWAEE